MSRPSRTRGLKHAVNRKSGGRGVASFTDAWIETAADAIIRFRKQVASFTDAWIETYDMLCVTPATYGSRPSRTRGLKLNHFVLGHFGYPSRPSRTRGLKQVAQVYRRAGRVASFTDAWIETKTGRTDSKIPKSRPSRTRGLKHVILQKRPGMVPGRVLHGRVD